MQLLYGKNRDLVWDDTALSVFFFIHYQNYTSVGKKRLSLDKRKIMQEELDTVNLLY